MLLEGSQHELVLYALLALAFWLPEWVTPDPLAVEIFLRDAASNNLGEYSGYWYSGFYFVFKLLLAGVCWTHLASNPVGAVRRKYWLIAGVALLLFRLVYQLTIYVAFTLARPHGMRLGVVGALLCVIISGLAGAMLIKLTNFYGGVTCVVVGAACLGLLYTFLRFSQVRSHKSPRTSRAARTPQPVFEHVASQSSARTPAVVNNSFTVLFELA